MNPSTKKLISLALMGVSLLATTGWAYTSFRARELVGSPFVWAIFMVAYFIGVALLPAVEVEASEDTKKSRRKKLVFVFLGIAVAFGIVFLLAHMLLGDSTRSSQSYAPWSVLTTLVVYIWYHRGWGKPAGAGGVMSPMLFFFGILFAPVMVIEIYNANQEDVVTLPSARSIPSAGSNYVIIHHPDVVPEKALSSTFHSTRNQNHKATFTALIPVRTGRVDTLFDTWIVMYREEFYYLSLGDSVIGRKERAFYAWCKERVGNFPYDSVTFYDKSKLNTRSVLEKNNYPIQSEAIVLSPVFVPLDEYATSEQNTYLFAFGLVTLFFWVATALYDPKTD